MLNDVIKIKKKEKTIVILSNVSVRRGIMKSPSL
jgi:hypothetical protein